MTPFSDYIGMHILIAPGIERSDVAKQLSISLDDLNGIIDDGDPASSELCHELAVALNRPLMEVLGAAGHIPKKVLEDPVSNKRIANILALLSKLPDDYQRLFQVQIRAVLAEHKRRGRSSNRL